MRRYKQWFAGVVATVVVGVGGVVWSYANSDTVSVKFFDIGQGDAILISQGTNQILIDGGRDEKALLAQLGKAMPFWDRTLEIVIVTHPDEDHIAGLLGLQGKYMVGQWLTTGATNDTDVWKRVSERATPQVTARMGTRVTLSEGKVLTVLWPRGDAKFSESDTNAGSIVARLDLGGKKTFLFTGDLPSKQETQIDVEPTIILKAGHHGSKYSTSDEWLDRVQPQDAILSVGAKNRYGHPALETLDRLQAHHVTIYRTDQQGTITYTCQEQAPECTVTAER